MLSPRNVMPIHSDPSQGTRNFKEVLDEVLHRSGKMSPTQLALKTNFSPSYISRVEHGKRPITEQLAKQFALVLGGAAEDWIKVYEETANGSADPVGRYVSLLLGDPITSSEKLFIGTRVRQLRHEEILDLFGNNDTGEVSRNGVSEGCEIDPFDATMVKTTSYDLTVGSVAKNRAENGDWELIGATEPVVIESKENVIIGTRQHVTLPSWLEAELAPASNIALKPLHVTNGPIIDPEWHGYLKVPVFNPTDSPITISLIEPFLTLRFWVAEVDGSRLR